MEWVPIAHGMPASLSPRSLVKTKIYMNWSIKRRRKKHTALFPNQKYEV
jgi:hypothetical protein